VRRVVEATLKSRVDDVVVGYDAEKIEKALFDRLLFDELMAIGDETQGLKAVVDRYRDRIMRVEVAPFGQYLRNKLYFSHLLLNVGNKFWKYRLWKNSCI
jgi:hypothetical protein